LTPAQSFRPGRPHQVAVVNDIEVLGLGKWNIGFGSSRKNAAAASTTAAAMAAEAMMMIIAKYDDLDCAVCTSNDGLRAFYAKAI
jgi:hypothetical protein